MDIFESLENLNVSEECFGDIIESIKHLIDKKYPEGTRENAILSLKAQNAALKNFHDMDKRGAKNSKWDSADRAFGADTKNAIGSSKTDLRRNKTTSRQLEEKGNPKGNRE